MSIPTNLIKDSRAFNENRDCAVIAIAAATGLDYAKAHLAMSVKGRQTRTGSSVNMILGAIDYLGFEAVPVPFSEILKDYPPCYREVSKLTPRQVQKFPKAWVGKGDFIGITCNHALAICNGEVLDWSDGRRHQIKRLFRIQAKG